MVAVRILAAVLFSVGTVFSQTRPGSIITQPTVNPLLLNLVSVSAGSDFATNVTSFTLTGTVLPAASWDYSWSVVSAPGGANVSMSGATALSNPVTVDQNGTYVFKLRAYKGLREASHEIQVAVNGTLNSAPTITSIANQTLDEDQASSALAFTVGDDQTAPGSLTILAVSNNTNVLQNSGIAIGGSGASRTITLTPRSNSNGVATVTVSVTDGSTPALTTTTSFQVGWIAVNDAPVLASIGAQSVNEDTPKVLNLTATDIEGTNLVYTASSANTSILPRLEFNGSGLNRTLTLTPRDNSNGVVNVTVNVFDGSGGVDSETFALTIHSVNDAPVLSAPLDVHTTVGESVTRDWYLFDVESAPGEILIDYQSSDLTVLPFDDIVNGGEGTNRTVTVTPRSVGTSIVTITADDGDDDTQVTFAVVASANPNTSPTISTVSNQSVWKNQPTSALAVTVSDAETASAQLQLSAVSSNPTLLPNANLVFGGSGASRTITATPVSNQVGTATITMTVQDGAGATAQSSWSLTVAQTNYPPTITQPSSQTMNEDGTLNIQVAIADPDTSISSLVTSGTSSQTSIVANSGIASSGTGTTRVFVITPVANANGSLVLTLRVSDGTTTNSVNVNLTVNAVNDSPTISAIGSQTTGVSQQKVVSFTVGDLETGATGINMTGSSSVQSVVANSGISFSGTGSGRSVTITPVTGASGSTVITLVATDPQNGSSSEQFDLLVSTPQVGVQWYVSTTGSSASANGTNINTPISLSVAFSGNGGRILPGHTVNLRAGTYNGGFTTTLSGNSANRITFRCYANEVVFIDRNQNQASPVLLCNGSYLDFIGINFRNSAARVSEVSRGSELYATVGGHRRFFFCSMANLENGIALQTKGSSEGGDLVYGCVSYYNGYRSGGDNKGHNAYIQHGGSDQFTMDKTVFAYSCDNGMQFYSTDESTPMRNLTVQRCFFLMWGRMLNLSGTEGIGLTTQANTVMSNMRVLNNYFWGEPGFSSTALRTSGNSVAGADLLVQGNDIYNGSVGVEWPSPGWSSATFRDNKLYVDTVDQIRYCCVSSRTFQNNTYRGINSFSPGGSFSGYSSAVGETGSSYASGDPGQIIVLLPFNDYPSIQHPHKAVLYVRTTSSANPLTVDISGAGIAQGQPYRILKAVNMFGGQVAGSGVYNGAPVQLNMAAVPMAAPSGLPLPENSAVSTQNPNGTFRTQVADVYIISSP